MTTDLGKGTTELGHQIAKLMATLTRAGKGRTTAQAVPQIAPDKEAMGEDRQTGVLLAVSAPIMARLVLDRLPWTAAHPLAAGQELQ